MKNTRAFFFVVAVFFIATTTPITIKGQNILFGIGKTYADTYPVTVTLGFDDFKLYKDHVTYGVYTRYVNQWYDVVRRNDSTVEHDELLLGGSFQLNFLTEDDPDIPIKFGLVGGVGRSKETQIIFDKERPNVFSHTPRVKKFLWEAGISVYYPFCDDRWGLEYRICFNNYSRASSVLALKIKM